MKSIVGMRWRLLVLLVIGCAAGYAALASRSGSSVGPRARASSLGAAAASAAQALALDRSRTRPLGHGTRFQPPAVGALVRAKAAVGALHCGIPSRRPYGAHIELFAEGQEIVVPAGIGIAPPQYRSGASVDGGGCVYPIHTADPTGVILIDPTFAKQVEPTLGDLFALWGQPLGARRVAGFVAPEHGSIVAFVDGRRRRGSPSAIPLSRHAQIVLEVGPRVAPHPSYRFAPGL